MAITTDSVPYEVLIRLNPDGSVKAAQATALSRILNNGIVINESFDDPTNIPLASLDALTKLTLDNQALRAQIATLEMQTPI